MNAPQASMSSISRSGPIVRLAQVFACALVLGCSSPKNESSDRAIEYVKIDDMEKASGRIRFSPEVPLPGALPGRWVSYADVQCERLFPVPEWAEDERRGWSYGDLVEPRQSLTGSASKRAARLRTTEPLEDTWGAGMGFQFSEPPRGSHTTLVTRPCTNGMLRDLEYPAAPVDLREYSSLVFWAKGSANTGVTTVLVQFQDSNTDPRGGVCDPSPSAADACENGFGVSLTLGETFTRYTVDLAELGQNPAWGYRPEPSVFDAERVYGLAFQMGTPSENRDASSERLAASTLEFDLWVDDLYFVRR